LARARTATARTIEILCLRHEAELHTSAGPQRKPLLVGFAAASDVAAVAKAPNFSETDSNLALARMLLDLPVEKWQRPLDQTRIEHMRTFFSAQTHLMPNPVLLAPNPAHAERALRVQDYGQETAGSTPCVLTISITPAVQRQGALWILDGQHRIAALSQSTQSDNPIPFVLLFNEHAEYTASEYASIFAQVTTKAQPLEEPHRSWLEYSFDLGAFDRHAPNNHRQAFEGVIRLASNERLVGEQTPNPFAGHIRFNPRNPEKTFRLGVGGEDDVFALPAQDFGRLLHRYYYRARRLSPLSANELADEIARAYLALREVIPEPKSEAAFFKAGNSYIQQGFLVGVLTHLLHHESPEEGWAEFLRSIVIHRGSWNFRRRPISTGGEHGNRSKKAAYEVFSQVFNERQLPAGAENFVSYLLGDSGTSIRISIDDADAGNTVEEFDIANLQRTDRPGVLARGRVLRVTPSRNIGYLRLDTSSRTPAFDAELTSQARSRNGFVLDPLVEDLERADEGVVRITVWCEFYGGQQRGPEIVFSNE
jgi:DNA-sulfur modification-associated